MGSTSTGPIPLLSPTEYRPVGAFPSEILEGWQNQSVIHDENPFGATDDDRARRLRGRLALPVTIITSGDRDSQTGLTVSSVFIVEGQPALLYAVITPNSDLYDVAQDSGAFVVHICTETDAGLADVFAGIRPSPGGMFATSEVEHTQWGPTLIAVENRIRCKTRSISEVGWSGILVGELVDSEISDLTEPLIYFRGSYRHLD